MALKAQKIPGLDAVNLFLQGGVMGGQFDALYGLVGQTLKISSPSAQTVTFAVTNGTTQTPLTLSQVIAQINAQLSGVHARMERGRLLLIEDSPTSGVAIDVTGTATARLGFGAAVGKVYALPGAAAPSLVSITPTTDNMFLVVTRES